VIGETIGNFKIVSRLGRGGMGEVWLAEQTSIGTRVAIKLLREEISEDVEHVQRFFNEARAVSRIQHAGIVKIFDVGHHNGQAYLIMEFLEGETLSQRIARSKRLSVGELGDIGRQIANVLDATHSAGITHRDLKPDNIFLVPDREQPRGERVKILDFGIAKLTGTLAAVSPRTTGTIGTPAYMAPEQWGDASKVDWRADLYSLGCVAFEMACGRPPFIVTNIAEACAKHLHDTPPRVREIVPALPSALQSLLDRLLAKSPDDRPGSMREVERAFAAIGSGDAAAVAATMATGEAHAPTVSAISTVKTRKSPVLPIVGGVAVVGIVGAVALLARREETPVVVVHASHPVDAAPLPPPPIDAATPPPVDAAVVVPPKKPAKPANVVPHEVPTDKEGTIDAEAVRNTYKNDVALRRCYLNELAKDPKLGGQLVATVTIDIHGKATSSTAAGVNPTVARCVQTRLSKLHWPPAVGAPVIVNIPIKFEPPTDEEREKPGQLTAHAEDPPDVPESPTTEQLSRGLKRLQSKLDSCQHGETGKAKLVLHVEPDGSVSNATLEGPLAGTPFAKCVEKLTIADGQFPKSKKGAKTSVTFTLTK
jgi:tRNA A-37 threonylcarbamoyl transferase component Bud32